MAKLTNKYHHNDENNNTNNKNLDMNTEFIEGMLEDVSGINVDDYDADNLIEIEREDPVLVIDVKYGLEAEFINSLLIDKDSYKGEESLIEVCIPLNESLKPLGYLPLTFDNFVKIKSYKDFDMKIIGDSEIEVTPEIIISLM